MNKVFITVLFLVMCSGVFLPLQAKERVVVQTGKTGIVSNGLYFQICDVKIQQKNIEVTVEAKNKSMLSQEVYVELVDGAGKTYKADNKEAISFFKPLKFNKPVTHKITFSVPTTNQNYWLAIYNRDIFKKSNKQLITKMSIKEAQKELNTK